MSTIPAVYYPSNLPGVLVADVAGVLQCVPMRADGWSSRYAYLGHFASLSQLSVHEAEIQLRSAGWQHKATHAP